MSRSAAAYTDMLQQLLPRGRAWTRDPAAVLTALLASRADGLAAIDAAADQVLLEADPRTAVQTLPAWERNFGLPLAGVPAPASIEAAQQAVAQQLAFQGGNSQGWWTALAAQLGFPQVAIALHRPFRAGTATAGSSLDTDPWRFGWTLTVYTTPQQPAASYNALVLQALFARYVAAHEIGRLVFVDPDAALFEFDFLAGP